MGYKASLLLLSFLVLGGCNSEQPDSYFNNDSQPATNIFFGDPYILLVDDTYYMYGTGQQSDTGIKVYKSSDLKEWQGPIGQRDGFALHEDDVYGDHSYWAPEVYQIDNRYYMFFSVEEHMAIAVSDSPKGPFTQESPAVLRNHKSIDHHLFTDDDGTKYIYFANFKDGLEIWGAKLNDDFSSIKEESLTKLLTQSQDWEKSTKEPVGIVNEGPYVLKRGDKYYMSYSGNHFASPDYGIGWASSNDPLGEWTKSEQNPVIQNPDSLVGTGHSSFFKDKNDELHIVYHAHYDTSEVHPRKVYINKVRLTKESSSENLNLDILQPRIIPMLFDSE